MGYVTVWELVLCCLVLSCAANSPPSLSGKIVDRVIAKVGKNCKLRCPANSDPALTQWKKNGQALNPGWERFKVSRDGDLRIRDVQLSDAGLYTCVATNGFGSMNINYTVIVLDEENNVFQEADKQFIKSPDEDITRGGSAPVFEEFSKMREMMSLMRPQGSTLRLTCKAGGNPQPKIQWYKDNVLYNKNRKGPYSTLKIHGATGKDSGRYTCVAANRLGQTNFTYNVQVIDEIRQMPKLIAPYPLNQSVNVGDSVSFKCFIESVVEPEVKWLKRVDASDNTNNVTLITHNEKNLMVLTGAGILQARGDGSYLNKLNIQSVRPQDAGMFVCLAANRKGYVSRQAYLQVRQGFTNQYHNPNQHNPNQHNSNQHNPNQHNPNQHNPSSSSDSQYTSSSSSSSSSSSDDDNLPLLIGLPACALLIIILITVFLLQRNDRCRRSSSSPTTHKVPRTPVPPAEREAYYYSNCQQQHMQQSINPLLLTRDKLPKTPTPSVDMTGSEFSSVSRTHHHHHHPPPSSHHYYSSPHSHSNHNYGY